MITLFKLRYNLPDRILEDLFRIDHVTISRIIIRISTYLSKIKLNIKDKESNLFYIVDSTVLRIGKGKNNGAIKEQKLGISQINEAVSHIDGITQENANLAATNSESSNLLKMQSKHLNHLIERFTYD